jgi:hypothetical protein
MGGDSEGSAAAERDRLLDYEKLSSSVMPELSWIKPCKPCPVEKRCCDGGMTVKALPLLREIACLIMKSITSSVMPELSWMKPFPVENRSRSTSTMSTSGCSPGALSSPLLTSIFHNKSRFHNSHTERGIETSKSGSDRKTTLKSGYPEKDVVQGLWPRLR